MKKSSRGIKNKSSKSKTKLPSTKKEKKVSGKKINKKKSLAAPEGSKKDTNIIITDPWLKFKSPYGGKMSPADDFELLQRKDCLGESELDGYKHSII